jgi:hypothetical protein
MDGKSFLDWYMNGGGEMDGPLDRGLIDLLFFEEIPSDIPRSSLSSTY